jgi:hypothetical protein
MMANPVPRGKPPPRGAYTTSGSPYRGVDRVIPRGKTISGRVLDPDGFPVHGARVGEIGARDSVRGVPGMADAVSDGQGRFEISGLVGDGERKLWVATDE